MKALSPSDISIDPTTGNYILITGPEKALLEITPQGQVVQSMILPGNPQQPEGVILTANGLLIVADESVNRPADITIYSWRGLTGETAAPASPIRQSPARLPRLPTDPPENLPSDFPRRSTAVVCAVFHCGSASIPAQCADSPADSVARQRDAKSERQVRERSDPPVPVRRQLQGHMVDAGKGASARPQ